MASWRSGYRPNAGVTLLANAIATGLGLYVLITILAPVSRAHFNPVVTLAAVLNRQLPLRLALAYAIVQATAQVAAAVGAYIAAAYWFTASTSFANPAVTMARSLSDTFAGIRPLDAPAFVVAQLIGMAAGLVMVRLLFGRAPVEPGP